MKSIYKKAFYCLLTVFLLGSSAQCLNANDIQDSVQPEKEDYWKAWAELPF